MVSRKTCKTLALSLSLVSQSLVKGQSFEEGCGVGHKDKEDTQVTLVPASWLIGRGESGSQNSDQKMWETGE